MTASLAVAVAAGTCSSDWPVAIIAVAGFALMGFFVWLVAR